MRSLSRGRCVFTMAIAALLVATAPAAAIAPRSMTHLARLGDGLLVVAPSPGYGVAASAILASGAHQELILETGVDGLTRDVTATAGSDAEAPTAVISRSPGACSDRTYHLLPTMWKSTWQWWFQSGSTPRDVSKSRAERALRSAAASITRERNDCGRPDRVSATASYQGRTTRKPGVTSTGGCLGTDGESVVGFGTLPAGVLGLTCTTYQIIPSGVDNSIESDVLFNKDGMSWTTTLSGCFGRAMLRSVATHEFGHVFGLNHVSESRHGNLTMSTAIGPCDDSAFTLGKGDMLGLEQRY